jgi:motility quorum-sensing regulator/GCU-specific mRNA interferase toxin
MEKKSAHYSLALVKSLVSVNSVGVTKAALKGAAQLGFSINDVKEIVMALEVTDLVKSMTCHHDHRVWQDVYHYPAEEIDIYLKIQIVRKVVIISFKEL